MARYSGNAMVVVFAGGTVSALFQTLEATQEKSTIDMTAGADTHEETIFDVVSNRVALTILSTSGTAGTAIYDALKPGQAGTLVYYPSGTAVGETIHTYTDAKVLSRTHTVPRGGRVEIACEFTTDVVEAVTLAA